MNVFLLFFFGSVNILVLHLEVKSGLQINSSMLYWTFRNGYQSESLEEKILIGFSIYCVGVFVYGRVSQRNIEARANVP